MSLAGFQEFPNNWALDWRLFLPATGNLPGLDPAMLEKRNLRRGFQMGLPSGQVLAAAMGEDIIADEKLKVGKATEEGGRLVAPRWTPFEKFRAANGEFRMFDLLKHARLAEDTRA